jgi:hypothetical protein
MKVMIMRKPGEPKGSGVRRKQTVILLGLALLILTGCPMDSSRRNNEPVEPPEYRPTEPPAAPVKLIVSAVDGQAALSWNIYAGANKFITAFEVAFGEADGEAADYGSTLALAPRDGRIYSYALIGGLANGAAYRFRVRAQNALGWSEWSEPAAATPAAAAAAPARPDVFFDMTRMGAGDLHPQWLAKNAVRYQVQYGTANDIDAASPWPADGSVITEPWAYIPSLAAGRYFVWVRAGNSAGWSDWEMVSRRTRDTSRPDITKNNINGVPVHNTVYIEVNNDDPRVAMGYTLVRDGMTNVPFFDNVIIFDVNVREEDCAAETKLNPNGIKPHDCTKSGVHLHFDGNVSHLLDNRDKYIKPLQDKGIKVSLGLLLEDDGFTYGTIGEWPFNDVSPVTGPGHPDQTQNGGKALGANPPAAWANGYPYNHALRTKLIQEIKDAIVQYQLDGVDFDDEYGSKNKNEYGVVYPGGLGGDADLWNYYAYGGQGNDAAWAIGGRQTAEFMIAMKEALDEVEPGRYLVTAYEFRYLRKLPETVQWKGKTVRVRDYVDYFHEAVYGSYIATAYTPGTPNSRYTPFACDVGGGAASTARPQYGAGYDAIGRYAENHLAGNYGANLFYCLMSRIRYKDTWTSPAGDTFTPKQSYFGTTGRMPEAYFSLIADRIYGGKVIYEGEDFPQDWVKRRYK